ncbi:MAG: hypothetical protein V1798_09975 [Pseudomonadota bacterium]
MTFGHMILRVFWMALGPGLMTMMALSVLVDPRQNHRRSVIIYFVCFGLVIGARFLTIWSGHGLDARGEPSTWKHFRRYLLWWTLGTAGLWALLALWVRIVT